jgi:hypothetical protein
LIDKIRKKNRGYEKVTQEKAEPLASVEEGPNKKRMPNLFAKKSTVGTMKRSFENHQVTLRVAR